MEAILEEYGIRVEEIYLMIDLLECQNTQADRRPYFFRGTEAFDMERENSAKHILISTVLVMIYNLAESTAVATVEYIYDHLKDMRVSYNDLNDNFKERILNDFKKKRINITNFIKNNSQESVSRTIIKESLDKKYFFSGNVDRRKIKEAFENISFSFETDSGQNLIKVKEARRQLTHSENSFARYGRNTSLEELRLIAEDVKKYFDEFLQYLKQYIEDEAYSA